MWRKKILPYFQYNKKERAGIIALLIIVILLWAIPFFFAELSGETVVPDITVIPAAIHSFEEQRLTDSRADSAGTALKSFESKGKNNFTSYTMVPFDPNTASLNEWTSMGIKPRTVSIIQHYLGKGGRFRKKEDLQKVFGLRPAEYERLAPFVRINVAGKFSEGKRSFDASGRKDSAFMPKAYTRKIDINTAGIEAWESLPGIGEKLAARIVGFREKLGGFVSVQQVSETYGIEPEIFNKILPRLVNEHAAEVRKVPLNSGSFDELKQHPYVGYRLARLLVAYREQHGEYKELSDLMNIPLFTNEVATRLSPYLEW